MDFAGFQFVAKALYPEEFKEVNPEENLKGFYHRYMPWNSPVYGWWSRNRILSLIITGSLFWDWNYVMKIQVLSHYPGFLWYDPLPGNPSDIRM